MNVTEEEIKNRLLKEKKKVGAELQYLSMEESKQALEYYTKNGVYPDGVYYDNVRAGFYRIKNKEESEENFRDYALISLLDEVATIKKVAIFFTVLAALQIFGSLIMFFIK